MRLNRLTGHLLAATTLASAALAQELPTTPTIVSGDVTIATRPGVMNLSHTTDSAIINWNNFSLGTGGEIRIDQPGVNAVLLNRVTGNTLSTIAGKITAPGQVFIINPNGIAITSTGVVNTAGFTASTLDISDANFLAKTYTFEGDGSSATVSNAGRIEVATGGYAALLGGRIDNSGSIVAPLGKIGLGAAELVTLDLTGDGFLQVAIPSAVSGSDPLISNSGLISANGGYVQMSVAAAKDAARNVINLSGTVEARSFSGRSGAIVLSGDGGAVTVTGKVDTSTTMAQPPEPKVTIIPIPAARPNFRGGDITITGNAIRLADADITATGYEGGGHIKVGGDFHGNGLVPTATTLDVDFLTSITADALIDGNGGTVVLWSDDTTAFRGSISARGAGVAGIGGSVEVSGKAHLLYRGTTDTRAPLAWGNLLLDPRNLVFTDGALDPDDAGYDIIPITGVGGIATNLATTNVTVRTDDANHPGEAGNIRIRNTPISWSAPTTLELVADGNIEFYGNSSLSTTVGSVIFRAAGSIFNPGDGGVGYDITSGTGNVTFVAGGDVFNRRNIEGANVSISGRNVGVNYVVATARVDIVATESVSVGFRIDAGSDVDIAAGLDINTLIDDTAVTSANGDIIFDAGRDLFLGHEVMTATNGSILLTAGNDANIGGILTAGEELRVVAGADIDLTTPPGASLTGPATLVGDVVYLEAGGTLFLRTGTSVTSNVGDLVVNTGRFVNSAGAGALTANGARYIVYSNDWEADSRGGVPGLNFYNRTYSSFPPGSVPAGVNAFVYARQPVLTFTIADAMRVYFDALAGDPSVSFTGLVNGDTIGYATDGDFTDIFDLSAIDSDVGFYANVLRPIGVSSPVGYSIVYVGGGLSVTPAPLTIIANSFSKIYGDVYTFTGTEFTTVGLRGTDVAGLVTLISTGASGTATVAGSPYAIFASNATGGDFGNYTISYSPGSLTVTPRALTVSALDLFKVFRTGYTFTGTEFTTAGLVNGDRVDVATLSSSGQPDDTPIGLYPILISGATGSGLENYTITYAPGTMFVGLPMAGGNPPPNYPPPSDTPTIVGLNDPFADAVPGVLGPEIPPSDARATLDSVEQISQQFAAAIAECERELETTGDEGAYLTCASDALEAYADALDNPLIKLPPELKAAVTVIRQTAQRVRTAAANPNRRAAVAEARQAVGEMVDFVRQQTALVRAVDPDTQALLQQSGQVMTQALNELDLQLVSAVEI